MSSTRVIRRQESYNQQNLIRVQFTQADQYPPNLSDTTPRLAMTLNPNASAAPFGNALVTADYNNTGAPKEGPRTQTVLYRFNAHESDDALAVFPDIVHNIPSSRTIVEFTPTQIRIPIVISIPVSRPADETWSHNRIWGPGSNNQLSASYQQYFYNNITQRGGNANSEFITDISGTIATMINVGNDVQTISATAKQIGVDTVAGGFVSCFIHTGGNPGTRNPLISIGSPNYQGTLVIKYEATNHAIDGSNGDTAPVIQSRFNIFTDITSVYDSDCLIQARSFLTEISQSVITGVEKTLQSNTTLSVTAQVEHRATATLTQETELLGTTFNFRFMEPLVIQSRNTISGLGNVKSNFAAPLSLSSESTANFTGNLIFDLIKEYRWDDFNIVGYFISGYSTAGYAADSADYGWDELSNDPWDAWTYSVWGGIEAAWDIWPDDVWNSTKTLTSVFSSSEIGHIIRSGVGQLLSRTALSDNSAFLITGASTVRSDFLCDGSPSGLIGGSSTIVSDAVLTALANYIINNSHTISGAFTPVLLANYIATFLFQAQSDFSLTVAPTFKPSGVTNAQCITLVNALANYKINNPQNIDSAFDPIFTARMFIGTDPYLIHKILQETRQIFVDAESRGIQIAEEIRLNSIPAENRAFLVPQETRSMKLRIPPMTNRFTTPKVRTE